MDTLLRTAEVSETAFADTSLAPDTAYEYTVIVINAGGYGEPSVRMRTDGYATKAVELLRPAVVPAEGVVALAWTRYRDPGFERYEIHRHAVGTDRTEILGVLADRADTMWADSTARAEVDYVYAVVTVAAGEEEEGPSRFGLCLPRKHKVLVDRLNISAASGLRWPTDPPSSASGKVLGTAAGGQQGEFLFPLSLAAGADGRIYVLDAGNSRIQVFDAAGNYLTEWDGHGAGAGRFDFGSGFQAEDFRGSVAVDGRGYIYVADVEVFSL